MPIPTALRRFTAARDGNIAIAFALAALPILAFTGAAIDYGSATRLQAKLQAATDATALALCQLDSATPLTALQAQARAMVAGYVGDTGLTIDPLGVKSNPQTITLTTHLASPALFGRLTGTHTMTPSAKAQCVMQGAATFEIALVIDTTYSMTHSAGRMTKMKAAQQAATNFIDYVRTSPTYAASSRIAVVPFAASVAVDPIAHRHAPWIDQYGRSSYHWDNVSGAGAAGFTSRLAIFDALRLVNPKWGWAGCLETLPYPLNVQDGSPGSSAQNGQTTVPVADSYYVPMFAPDEPGDGSKGSVSYDGSHSENSYIDDSTWMPNCPDQSRDIDKQGIKKLTFFQAEARACKYVVPVGAASTDQTAHYTPNGPNLYCTSKPLQRLTSNTTTLKTLVASLAPMGYTNILEGVMWGWRTISPSSVFGDGAAYSDRSVRKIIVLMTDGQNDWHENPAANANESFYFSMGYFKNADGSLATGRLPPGTANPRNSAEARAALDALTRQGCTNAKAAGISIYTVGFSTRSDPIDAQGLKLLKDCASTAGQAFVATTADSLIAAFDKISKSVGTLRLSQ